MGFFDFLFGKSEVIWTLDVYIEAICSALSSDEPNREEAGVKIRQWGREILGTYGMVGIEHAWRAAALSSNREELFLILQREWQDLPGWKRAD